MRCKLLSKKLRYTFKRNSIFYVQFLLPHGSMFKRSLDTDSYREAQALMIALAPFIPKVKSGEITPIQFCNHLDEEVQGRMLRRATNVHPVEVKQVAKAVSQVLVNVPVMTLIDAWKEYKVVKGKSWTISIASANERYMEVILAVLGKERDVTAISKKDIRQVMEAVEGLPKRVVQPYRAMTIHQLLSCDDVPEEQVLGTEAIHKHLKIYKSLFKTYLTNEKGVLQSSPTDGVLAPPSSTRFGAYTNSEVKKMVSYAVNNLEEWLKWIVLLLAYTGARRGEIATLTKAQVQYDDDSIRYYLLIKEGKTENAVRQVPLHQHLIDLGFLSFVQGSEGKLFPEVAGTNMAKIGKVISDIREHLNIPYRDIHGQRRIVHSLRHSVVTAATGWMNNLAHLQQVIGHEKTGTGITGRYMHTFPLSNVCHIIDGLNWQ